MSYSSKIALPHWSKKTSKRWMSKTLYSYLRAKRFCQTPPRRRRGKMAIKARGKCLMRVIHCATLWKEFTPCRGTASLSPISAPALATRKGPKPADMPKGMGTAEERGREVARARRETKRGGEGKKATEWGLYFIQWGEFSRPFLDRIERVYGGNWAIRLTSRKPSRWEQTPSPTDPNGCGRRSGYLFSYWCGALHFTFPRVPLGVKTYTQPYNKEAMRRSVRPLVRRVKSNIKKGNFSLPLSFFFNSYYVLSWTAEIRDTDKSFLQYNTT